MEKRTNIKGSVEERAIMAVREIGSQTTSKLAAKYGVSRGSIHRYARMQGIESCALLRRPWSREDIKILVDNAGIKTTAEIGEMINRTASMVRDKASQLKISVRVTGEKHHAALYSDDDVHYTKILLDDGELSRKEIAKLIDVPVSFVQMVAHGLRN